MMFIRVTNGVPENYTIGELRRDNPTVSFPRDIPLETLASYSVFPLTISPQPQYNELTQSVRLLGPVNVSGKWVQNWEVSELPLLQQAQNIKAARESAYRNEADALFFKAQRGEADMQEWQDKIQEIRGRVPYPPGITEEMRNAPSLPSLPSRPGVSK